MDEIRIPKERVAILIGKKGETLRMISKFTNTKIKVDSREGDVIINGENGFDVYNAKRIIQAVGRGFSPDKALELLEEDIAFEIINMQNYARNKNDIKRIKARVIGAKGKAKKMIENLADVDISVYGKTVCVIGMQENVNIAGQAIIKLLSGSRHGKVYSFLEKQRRLKHIKEL